MGDPNFILKSKYKPSGDQPEAILELTNGIRAGKRFQTLLGATGTGKTFTIANVVANVQKPTLVIAHNKTLAAQLCNEFRTFFPENAVEYFVSYYDYYQPEAYIPRSDTYIEKEAMINEEIDRLRHAATQALLTRKDVLIVASVSCIYGLGAPEAYEKTVLHARVGESVERSQMLQRLIEMQFVRTNADLKRGMFRARGEVLEIMPANEEVIYRIEAPQGIIERIEKFDPVTRRRLDSCRSFTPHSLRGRNDKRKSGNGNMEDVWIFPAKHFITSGPDRARAMALIRAELKERIAWFEKRGKLLEVERLERRTKFDLEMIETIGYCHGIENYSRPLSGRPPGAPPDTLFSYFPDDFLLVIDESHVTVPQLGGMFEGDRSRKETLIEYGFRLPSALDNRPMKFDELEKKMKQAIFMSATPGPYELRHSSGVVEQIIRPTGLVDPEVTVKPITAERVLPSRSLRKGSPVSSSARLRGSHGDVTRFAGYPGQVEDLIRCIPAILKRHERVLVTTLTKKMAEDLTEYLQERKFKARYLHSDIDTIERLKTLSEFRHGGYDIMVGVNLLREGLDLPEVSLVAILDADKEGFLRSETSLIQTIGRAARNAAGQVILYADHLTGSMRRAIEETDRRRKKQLEYNKRHGIRPRTIKNAPVDIRAVLGLATEAQAVENALRLEIRAETRDLSSIKAAKEQEMKEAALRLDFELAAILRDEIAVLEKEIKKRNRTDTIPAKARMKRPPRHGRAR